MKNKIFTILAFCLAFAMSLGMMLVFNSDKKVYAEEAYFMAVEKYRLPVDDNGLPDLKSLLNLYDSIDNKYNGAYMYDSINGEISNEPVDFDEDDVMSNWTSIFVKFQYEPERFVNIVDFLREISKHDIYVKTNDATIDENKTYYIIDVDSNYVKVSIPDEDDIDEYYEKITVELVQTLATNDVNVADKFNIAMLKTKTIETGLKEYAVVSFMPMGQHAKLNVIEELDDDDRPVLNYNWVYASSANNASNFQTFTVNANLNEVSIKAQTQYQSLTSAKKFYEFATDLSNITGADESEAYPKYDAQGHYTFEFTYTDANGAGSGIRPTADFYVLDENYYLNGSNINGEAKIQPKLWNVRKDIQRDEDNTNIQLKDKKEFDSFGYNNSVTVDYNGDATQPDAYANAIQYPTITFDPTRYTLSYYFVDRSLDSGALQIITSELNFVEDQLVLELSNGKQFEVRHSPLTFNENTDYEWTNEIYEVDVEVQDLGKYVFQFDFALNRVNAQNKTVENHLAVGARKIDNNLERNRNWDLIRDEQYQAIGTDELTIFGYQLFYSVYDTNGNTTAELKKVDDGYFADVTNLYENNVVNIYTDNDNNPLIPTTNQPPLFFRYGEGQTLSSMTYNRYKKYGDATPINENGPIPVDNIYRFASTGREILDNGYYEVFVNYKFSTYNKDEKKYEDVVYTQVFAFEVKYTSPTIYFDTFEDTMTLIDRDNPEIKKSITLTKHLDLSTQFVFDNKTYKKNSNNQFVWRDGNNSEIFEFDFNNIENEINKPIAKLYVSDSGVDSQYTFDVSYEKDWTGIGFTNQHVKVNWSNSLNDKSPFDVPPVVTISVSNDRNGTIQPINYNASGFAYLSVKDNSYSAFTVKIEWGPINANRPNKTYTFTIDKTNISDFVKLVVNDGENDVFFNDMITNSNKVRALYGQNLSLIEKPSATVNNSTKDSGAGISMTYTLLQMSANNVNPQIIANKAVSNGYEISNILNDNTYVPFIGENGAQEKNYFPDVNAIFVLNFVDDAGNTYTRYFVVDHTAPKMLYRVADQKGNFPAATDTDQGWLELTYNNNYIKTNAQIYRGNYKAINIYNSDADVLEKIQTALESFTENTNVLIENNVMFVKLNNQKAQELLVVSRDIEDTSFDYESKDILGNLTFGMLFVSHDSVKLHGLLTGNYPNNIQNIGNLVDKNSKNYGARITDADETTIVTSKITTRQHLQFEWTVLEENYVVEKVEYEYYPFDLSSTSSQNTNPNYPFMSTPDDTVVVYDRNDASFSNYEGKTQYINLSTGNKEFSGGTATRQGLYIVTRTYNHAQFENAVAIKETEGEEELDTEVRKYYFYIDRNNIITQLDNLTNTLSIIMGNGTDLSSFGGTQFLDDVLNTNGYVLTTNKQKISINIPVQKYKTNVVIFEGYDYKYNQTESKYDTTHYKLFFMDNGNGYSGNLIVIKDINNSQEQLDGTYSKHGNNNSQIELHLPGNDILASIPAGNGIIDENCKNMNFNIDTNTKLYLKRYTQNMLYYKYDVNNGNDISATGEKITNAAKGASETDYIYTVCVNDIDKNYVSGITDKPFTDSIYNGLVFRYEVNLEKPQTRWVDESGLETSNNHNTNTIKLVWDTYDRNIDFHANIEETDISVQKQVYVNGQIQTTDLGKFRATNDNMNSISIRDIEDSNTSTKYLLKIKYKNAEYYYDFGQATNIFNYDKTKPYYNYANLFAADKFLGHLTQAEKNSFQDFNADINFENYAFVVADNWHLDIPKAQEIYKQDSIIPYDKLFVSQTDNLDKFDLDAAWYRKYDKKYNGTNPENLQSIVPGDSRYGDNTQYANYMFDPNLTRKLIDEQTGEETFEKIYTEYHFGENGIGFEGQFEVGQNGNYYEVIEKDIAGNYRVYTIFVTNDSTRKIEFELDDNYLVKSMGEDGRYLVKEKDETETELEQKFANILKNTEINSFVKTPLVIKEIVGLGEYYDVTIKNLATNSTATTIRRTKNADILSQINSVIQNNFSNGRNGNNFEIKFFAPTDEYIINYRTEGELNVMYVSTTNTLTFTVDPSMGSYIKSFKLFQDGNEVYNLGDSYAGNLFNLSITRSGTKTTYMLKFNLSENNGTQLKYEYVDNFNKLYKDFKVIGIENTNFEYDPNDTTGSNMLIFGDGTSTGNHNQITNPEKLATPEYDNDFEFTKVAEFYTGESIVKFRYQTKVYSNVKIYEVRDNDDFRQLKNLPSSTSSTNFKNITQIYNNNDENIDKTYIITFVDPIGNTYEYIIHHYTMLAEITFEGQDDVKMDFEETAHPQVTDVFTMYITNQPELYPTVVTATRTLNNITTKLGVIKTGYPFNLPGTYVVTASNQVGLIKTYVFTYIESGYSSYTITATSLNGITRILMPNEKIKYEYENGYIDLYFALKSEAVNITLGSKDFELGDPSTSTTLDGTTTSIYEITSTKISTYSKKFAIIQVKASTDLLLGEMTIDDRYISASTLSVQSISKVVSLKIRDFYRDEYNKLIVKAKYNGRDLGEIDGIIENGYRIFNFDVAGDYVLSISDQAGNMHLFNDTTQYFTLSVLNNISYRINGKEPIKNSYYNDPVVLNVLNLTKFYADKNQPYVTEVVTLNGRVIDNTQYSKVNNGTYYTYTFSQYGSYNVEFTGYVRSVSEENKVVTNATFTILNQNQARIIHEYIGLNGYRVVSILKDNEDITNLIKQKSGTAILNQFALFGGTGKNIVGGNGRYTITVSAYLGNFVGYQEFTYNVWLNNETTALIESSIAPGSSTTKSIYLKMNLYQIYSKIGECKIKLNGKDYITINSSTATENLISTYELTSNKSYYISVETDNGNTLLSFVVTKKEPLNTVAIIVIVAVSVVGTALAVTFVLLRKRMRVR